MPKIIRNSKIRKDKFNSTIDSSSTNFTIDDVNKIETSDIDTATSIIISLAPNIESTSNLAPNINPTSNLATASINPNPKTNKSSTKNTKKTSIKKTTKKELLNKIEEFEYEFELTNINEFLGKNNDQKFSPSFGEYRKWCIEIYSSDKSTDQNIADEFKYLDVGFDLFRLNLEDLKIKKTIYSSAQISIINQFNSNLNVDGPFDYCDFKLVTKGKKNYNKKDGSGLTGRDLKIYDKFIDYQTIKKPGFIIDDKLKFMVNLRASYTKELCEL